MDTNIQINIYFRLFKLQIKLTQIYDVYYQTYICIRFIYTSLNIRIIENNFVGKKY